MIDLVIVHDSMQSSDCDPYDVAPVYHVENPQKVIEFLIKAHNSFELAYKLLGEVKNSRKMPTGVITEESTTIEESYPKTISHGQFLSLEHFQSDFGDKIENIFYYCEYAEGWSVSKLLKRP